MNLKNINPVRVPTSSDFTQASLNKKLFQYSIAHWSFRYTIPFILGAIVFGVLFSFSYELFLTILFIFGFGCAAFIFNVFFKGDKIKKKYTELLLKLLEEQTEQKLKNLENNLLSFKQTHGAKQLEQFRQKFEILVDILKYKFDVSQLTYNRYYSIAREVYLSGIDNLNDLVIALKTLDSIDLEYINDRLKSLKDKDPENMAIKKEVEALNRSLNSFKQQEQKVYNLIAENETALTQMDEATIAISEISKSKDKEAGIDMENSMKALAELAQRTKLYSER